MVGAADAAGPENATAAWYDGRGGGAGFALPSLGDVVVNGPPAPAAERVEGTLPVDPRAQRGGKRGSVPSVSGGFGSTGRSGFDNSPEFAPTTNPFGLSR